MNHEYQPQLRAELMALLRQGKNLLEAQVRVQSELLSELNAAADQIKDEYNRGELR